MVSREVRGDMDNQSFLGKDKFIYILILYLFFFKSSIWTKKPVKMVSLCDWTVE